METILQKDRTELTREDRERLQQYMKQYEPLLERIDKALSDIDRRLSGMDPVQEYVPTPAECAQAKLSSVMRKLKTALSRVGTLPFHDP